MNELTEQEDADELSQAPESGPKLRVGAHVLTQLGRELVTDIEQAMLELVKNAYDADSPDCSIVIDPDAKGSLEQQGARRRLEPFLEDAENVHAASQELQGRENAHKPTDIIVRRLEYTGSIVITDRGVGLSKQDVLDSWLVVSNSIKRGGKGERKPATPKGRIPLGDKGLGRLGTMRLGDVLLVRSAQKGSDQVHSAWFRWKDCEGAQTLDRIPVELLSEPNSEGLTGTQVCVYGLNDIGEWSNPERAKNLSYSIASIVSPFEAVETFPVSVRIGGQGYDLEEITNDLLKQAVSTFAFEYRIAEDGDGELSLTARFRKSLFTSTTSPDKLAVAQRILDNDEGRAFFDYLSGGYGPNGEPGSKNLKKYDDVRISPGGSYVIELNATIPFSKIVKGNRSSIADPGAFNGAFHYFNFNTHGSHHTAATREKMKRMKGIAILRDGFRVRAGEDWLDLARSMTSGSFYHLRVDNTVGYFALSGQNNFMLTEKSDREGFIDDSHYRGFIAIAQACREFANKAQADVRRGLDEYAKLVELDDTGAASLTRSKAMAAIKAAPKVLASATNTSTMIEKLKSDLALLSVDGRTAPSKEREDNVFQLAKMAIDTFERSTNDTPQLRDLTAASTFVSQQIESQDEQIAVLVESAAVGLAARGLTHELRTHLAEIERSAFNIRQVSKNSELASGLSPHLRLITLAIRSILAAAAHIDPMLPRTRAVKERLGLGDALRQYFDNRSGELESEGIIATVEDPTGTMVKMNRIRFLQTIDNLAKNSRYWLQTDESPPPGERRILATVNSTGFDFQDNGEGVEPRLEHTLFDVFTSEKPNDGSGQGIGLYIVSQLLALDGATIELMPDRNDSGRLYKFRVDLSPLIMDETT